MRGVLRSSITVIAAVAIVLSMGATSAQAYAKTMTRGSSSCTVDVEKPALTARGHASACSQVQVYVKYNDYGTNYIHYGAKGGYSVAEAGTSSGLVRGVRAVVAGSWSGWSTF